MTLYGGYFKKILWIDLTSGESRTLDFGDAFALKYVGGRGFGIKLLWDHLRKVGFDIDALSPDNLLVIAPGPLTGLYLPASGKTSFVSLSPATGGYGDSNMGGSFGVELRQAGYDAIAITGRAQALSYLWIDDDSVKIVKNEKLKGRGCLETEGIIKKELGDPMVKIALVGPAGEKLVRFACVSSDWSRNAGRTGMGAVLGSKNIKAIAIRGSKDLPVYNMDMLKKVSAEGFQVIKANPYFEFWQQQGLMSVVDYLEQIGGLPTRNFSDAVFEGAKKINGYEMEAKYKIGDSACFACPISCGNINLVKEGPYSGTVAEGPEYETACMFGSNLGVDNFAFILRANHLCDDLGLDTISTGNLIGVLMEACEKDLLAPSDLDGISLGWGDEAGAISIIEKMAGREGVGDILAEGASAVIKKWPQLEPILMHVKGLEQVAYDARPAISQALGYGTSDIGAHHARAWTIAKEIEMGADWSLEEKADLVIYHQTVRPFFDMLGVCRLPWIELGFGEQYYTQYYEAVTGVKRTLEELLALSNDLYSLTRLINIERGIDSKYDYPPPRTFNDPVISGPRAGKAVDRETYDELLQIYYKKRGWDEKGAPPESTKKAFDDALK
jgi:aldehyde:ferredoxin oxidoreductase